MDASFWNLTACVLTNISDRKYAWDDMDDGVIDTYGAYPMTTADYFPLAVLA